MSTRPRDVIVDLHTDLLWRAQETGKDPWADCPGEMLDLPRMLVHGPSLQCFALFTPASRQGEAATAFADGLLALFDHLVERGAGRLRQVRAREEVLGVEAGGLAGLLTMEGVSPLRGDIGLLDHYHRAGVRVIGLTHNPPNEAGHGCMVPDGQRQGLTAFGRELVRACAERGILLDVAHLAPEGMDDLLDEVAGLPDAVPVVSSHTGCRALTDHPRNLTDARIRDLAATGGLVGITLFPGHVRRPGGEPDLGTALDHVEHVAALCGVAHVALGTDLDGFDPPGLPGGGGGPECYGEIARGLAGRGFGPEDVAAVLGGNALRVLGAVLR